MKNFFKKFVFSFFLIVISSSLFSQGWWYRKADCNLSGRTAAVGVAVGTGGLIGTGYDSAAYRRNFSSYNSINDTWTQTQSMGGTTGSGLSRNAAAAFVIGTKVYVATGQGSNPYLNDTWEYDAGADVWSQKANFGGTPRRSAVGFSLNNKGYVTCGQDAVGLKKDTWMYDPATNSWTSKAAFSGTARRLPVAFVIGNIAYVGTGDDGTFKKDFYQYNPTSDVWLSVASFGGTPRYGASAFAIGTDGYVGTGYDNTLNNKKDFWRYTPASNTWNQIIDFAGTPRSNAVAFTIGSYGYLGTGYDSLPEKDFWRYEPLSNGIDEMNKFKSSIRVYPNPMSTTAIVSFDEASVNAFSKISFKMFNLEGKLVRHIDNIRNSEFTVERGELQNGMYLYSITADGHFIASGKLIIH
jgi:hypothetical protein